MNIEEPQSENIPLKIVYEDEHLLVIDKVAGMVVHPSPKTPNQTLVNALLHHYPAIVDAGGEPTRPGIVHRLDKGTSGLLVVAKEQECYQKLVELFKTHSIERVYQAIVQGSKIPLAGKLTSTIGRNPSYPLRQRINVASGKWSTTNYRVEEYFGHDLAHLIIKLETGRTHQIRVHTASLLKAPVVGDSLYGHNSHHLPPPLGKVMEHYPYPLLHAKELQFVHPLKGEKMSFSAPPPPVFVQCLKLLRE